MREMNHKSFILYASWYEPLKNLSKEDKGEILDAIFQYHLKGELPELSPVAQMAFSFMKSGFDENKLKYDAIVTRNQNNIKKRWKNDSTKNTSGKNGIPKIPVATDNDNDNGSGSGSGSVNDKNNISVIFEQFRLKYPGAKGGKKPEFENFIKKNNPEIVNQLLPALEKEIEHKAKLKNLNLFCPDWKHLSTWINNKCWEQELPEILNTNVTQTQKSEEVYYTPEWVKKENANKAKQSALNNT